MTDFTLSSGSICVPYRSPWGNFPIKTMSVSTGISSAAIVVGRALTLDWTGSTVAGRVLPSTANGPMFFTVGIAASPVSGSTALAGGQTTVEIWESNPLVEFAAVTKGATIASSHTGLHKTLHYDSTLAIMYVDLTASTASDWRVVVTDINAKGSAEGDSGGYVAFRFLSKLTENVGSSIAITSTSPVLAFYA